MASLTPPAATAPPPAPNLPGPAAAGVGFALVSFLVWGLNPLYFHAVRHVPALEVLAHRIAWSVPLMLVLLVLLRRLAATVPILRQGRNLLILAGSSLLVACNWLIYIWAVQAERVLDASLGYFINPLVNVLLGMAFLGERLRRWQAVAVGLAAASVLVLGLVHGRVPWVALSLALTFGFYGLVRKAAPVDALTGLFAETLLLLPVALCLAGWLALSGRAVFAAGDATTNVLLPLGAVVTVVPLGCFVAAARRLSLTALGFLQYLAPTAQFLLAVWVFGEEFDGARALAFGGIWAALALYSVEGLLNRRRRRRGVGDAAPIA